MLDNTITLPVDEARNNTLVNNVYSRNEEFQNRSVYIGTDHTLIARNMLAFYRTQPKKSGNFPGVAKVAVKLTQDFSIPGVDTTTTLITPGIIETTFSLPVGLTDAQVIELTQRMIATLDTAAVIDALTRQLQI